MGDARIIKDGQVAVGPSFTTVFRGDPNKVLFLRKVHLYNTSLGGVPSAETIDLAVLTSSGGTARKLATVLLDATAGTPVVQAVVGGDDGIILGDTDAFQMRTTTAATVDYALFGVIQSVNVPNSEV